MEVPRFQKMIGEVVNGIVPSLSRKTLQLKIVAVDAGGLWVESQDYTNRVLKGAKISGAPLTPVLFLPFSAISYLVRLQEGRSLSEESYGLAD